MCEGNVEEAEESALVLCDRCDKVRCVKGDVPDGRWTCCHQPAEFAANDAAGKRWERAAPTRREWRARPTAFFSGGVVYLGFSFFTFLSRGCLRL